MNGQDADMRPLALIVGFDADRAIGKAGSIPWHHSADMKHFRRTTNGHAIIMGRATHASIGKPLPNRHNIVLTRQSDYVADGCTIVHSLNEALATAYKDDDMPFIIGGGQLYAEALPRVTHLYLTDIPGRHNGDAFFPALPEAEFREIEHRQEGVLTFRTFKRVQFDADSPVDR